MGKLEDLQKKLYGQAREAIKPERRTEGRAPERRTRGRVFAPNAGAEIPSAWREQFPTPPRNEEKSAPVRKTIIQFAVWALVLFFAVAVGAFIFFYLGTRGQEVEVAIDSRATVESGEILTVPVAVKNISSSPIREVEATLILPEGSLVREDGREFPAPPRLVKKLDDIGARSERVAEFTVRIFGRQDEEKTLEAVLLYRPENLRARFSARAARTVRVRSVPLAIAWDLPETVASGQEVEASVRYASHAPLAFDSLSLRLEYPPGFRFVSADPEPIAGESIWTIGTIEPNREGSISVRGVLSGEEGEIKAFRAGLGVFNALTREWRVYSDSTREARIAVTPLFAAGLLNGSTDAVVAPGDELNFQVRYRNNTAYALKNVSVRTAIAGSVVDASTIEIQQGGVFDGRTQEVLWGPGNTPELRELASGQEGALEFRLRTRMRPPVRTSADKNLAVRMRTVIEAPTVPEDLAGVDLRHEDAVDFKVSSVILFSGRTAHRVSPVSNIGPLPPRVGQKTTYVVVWEVRNFTNDLEDVSVRATLPPNVEWTGVRSPSDADIAYDPASGEVRWNIKRLAAGVGILTPALAGAFQVAVTPGVADAGRSVFLVNEARFAARDGFTDQRREERIEALSTELREESGSEAEEWRVVR